MLILKANTASTQQAPPTPNSFKQEFLNYINATRQHGCNCGTRWFPPAAPLTWNNMLQKSAYAHAKDMNDKNYFSHTSKDGRNMEDRIVLAGYKFNGYKVYGVGENIAMGQQSISQVMDDWIKSEGHCRNLMNPNFKEIGIAQYNDYWVQDFGGREAFTAEEQKLIKSGKMVLSSGVKTTHHD
ncbi:MAG: CAP domain-containing protein [Bacteroidota bacterium]